MRDDPLPAEATAAARLLAPSVAVRPGLSVLAKLVALIAVVVSLVVVVLTLYFPARHLRSLEAMLHQRATVYGQLIGRQLHSAVAFDDQETARETLASIAADPLVTGIGVYTRGRALRVEGKLSRHAELAGANLNETRIYEFPDRVVAVQAVRSLEGPRGTLVIELSKASLERSRQELTRVALLVGFGVLLFALVLTFLIARSMTRRVRSVAEAAAAVARGELDGDAVEVTSNDEIGALARSFNAMVEQLRALITQIRRSAQEEQKRLETLVAERTRELAARNQELRLVMDHVEQGFLTIAGDGTMSEERSRAVDLWFGSAAPGTSLWSYLDRAAPGCGTWFEMAFSQVLDGFLPLEVALDQMPKRIEVANRHYTVAFRPMTREDGTFDRTLVVISDATAVVDRERIQEEEQENLGLVRKLLEDQGAVEEFIEDARELVGKIESRRSGGEVFLSAVHTLKGNAGLLGLTSVSRACHELEGELAESSAGEVHREPLLKAFDRIDAKIGELLQLFSRTSHAIDDTSRDELLRAIQRSAPHAELEQLVQSFALEPVELRMKRAADQVRALAERLGKGPVRVQVECDRIRGDRNDWQTLWQELPHVLRNAVDHGLESAEERRALGKPAEAVIYLRAFSSSEGMVVEVEDSGRGIAWDGVRRKARELGLIQGDAVSPAMLTEALFLQGVTTLENATESSGRGVGLAAVRQVVARRGGRIAVESRLGQGTKFSFVWPSVAPAQRRERAVDQAPIRELVS